MFGSRREVRRRGALVYMVAMPFEESSDVATTIDRSAGEVHAFVPDPYNVWRRGWQDSLEQEVEHVDDEWVVSFNDGPCDGCLGSSVRSRRR